MTVARPEVDGFPVRCPREGAEEHRSFRRLAELPGKGVDGDLLTDLLVGAPGSGRVWLAAGEPGGFAAEARIAVEGGEGFGTALSLGDMDADGRRVLVKSGAQEMNRLSKSKLDLLKFYATLEKQRREDEANASSK